SSLFLLMPLVPEAGAWPIPTREEGNLHPRTTPIGRTWRHGCAAKRRQVPLRRSGKGRMNLREPRRQNKQGAVAGGSTEGVTPFFGPAALRTGFKICTLTLQLFIGGAIIVAGIAQDG